MSTTCGMYTDDIHHNRQGACCSDRSRGAAGSTAAPSPSSSKNNNKKALAKDEESESSSGSSSDSSDEETPPRDKKRKLLPPRQTKVSVVDFQSIRLCSVKHILLSNLSSAPLVFAGTKQRKGPVFVFVVVVVVVECRSGKRRAESSGQGKRTDDSRQRTARKARQGCSCRRCGEQQQRRRRRSCAAAAAERQQPQQRGAAGDAGAATVERPPDLDAGRDQVHQGLLEPWPLRGPRRELQVPLRDGEVRRRGRGGPRNT